ncbi:MAG: hypothetical protein U0800_18410 [Isosphaeraceae bacterium]
MQRLQFSGWMILVAMVAWPTPAPGQDDGQAASIERGRRALTEQGHLPGAWSLDAYRKVGSFWDGDVPDPEADPDGYFRAFCRQYGLHPAPYPNDGLPMGLRKAARRDGSPGLQIDCMVCHGGSIGGRSYVGIGNTTLDLRSLLDDLTRADGKAVPPALFTLTTTRGTVNAGQIAIALFSFRNPDLSRRGLPLRTGAWLPELDTPAWWNLGPKTTMYQDGRTDARSHRSIMQFFLDAYSADDFRKKEPVFADVMAYLKSQQPPRYPFPIDDELVSRGRSLFEKSCARCHGNYGPDGSVDYPNVVVELDRIGTDSKRSDGISRRFVEHVNASWFGEEYPVELEAVGYQAPPLRGVWATAPYLHNGMVPTLDDLLNSTKRPSRFRRPESTDFEHYDTKRVGWKYGVVEGAIPDGLKPREARFYADTARFGLGNGGHTFGDALTEDERLAVIEFLKTL